MSDPTMSDPLSSGVPGGPAPEGLRPTRGDADTAAEPHPAGPAPPYAHPHGVRQPPLPWGPGQAYPGAPPTFPDGTPYRAPAAPHPYGPVDGVLPAGADPRPSTVATIALVLAIGGAVLAAIPFLTWVSGPFLLTAFVLAIVALASGRQGGRGRALGGLLTSIGGWLLSIIVTIVSFGILGWVT